MTTLETLSPQQAEALLQQQKRLQGEAQQIIEELNLYALLQKIGNVRQLGSSTLGLMVWRDIDIAVSCPPGIELQKILQEAMNPIFSHPSIQSIRFLHQAGHFKEEELDPRYYFGIYYRSQEREEWKIDISFWLDTFDHPETIHDVIEPKITEADRLTILWIKDIWYRLPTYRFQVYSTDIYDAVLNHQVQTPTEFDAYLQTRGKPTRNR